MDLGAAGLRGSPAVPDVSVRHLDGDRFLIGIRGHEVLVDQPIEDGGEDRGPTPTELFVAGLASCVGFYAERFMRRHGLEVDGLTVDCDFEMSADRPARVAAVDLRVRVPAGFREDRLEALRRVVEHCTVENSIRQAPLVRLALAMRPQAA